MLKIKDKLGKLLAVLRDQDTQPEQKSCCEKCDCCCSEKGCKDKQTKDKQ